MLLILPRNLSAYIAFADADADSRVHTHHPIEVSLVGIFPDPTPLFNVSRQRKTIIRPLQYRNAQIFKSDSNYARSKYICFTYSDVEFPSEC